MDESSNDGPWDAFSLAFADPSLEDKYWQARVRGALCWYDFIIYLNTVIHWALLFFTLPPNPSTPKYVSTIFFPSFLCAEIVLTYCSFYHTKCYTKWRAHIVLAVRIAAAMGVTDSLFFQRPEPLISRPTVLARMTFQATVAASFILGVGLRLPFRLHLVVEFLCCTIAMLLIPSSNETWFLKDERISIVCQFVGQTIDRTIRMLLLVGGNAEQEQQYSCCFVMYFFHWAVGFVVSSAVIYCLESYSRMEFILNSGQLTQQKQKEVLRVWWLSLPTSLLGTVIGAALLWELLKVASHPAT